MDKALARFLSPEFEDVFSNVAMIQGAADLIQFDVPDLHAASRQAIEQVVKNASEGKKDPGARTLLIRGGAGSGKTHALATSLKSLAEQGVAYPVVIQATAPVREEHYAQRFLVWLTRDLGSKASFPHPGGCPPLQTVANKLLNEVDADTATAYRAAYDDNDDEALLRLASTIAGKVCRTMEDHCEGSTVAAVVLAAARHPDGLAYLRGEYSEPRFAGYPARPLHDASSAMELVEDIAQLIRFAGGALVVAYDQVESMERLGSAELLAHAVHHGVMLAQKIPNCAVVFAALRETFENLKGLTWQQDLDRVERTSPKPVPLTNPTPQQLRDAVRLRLEFFAKKFPADVTLDVQELVHEWLFTALGGVTLREALRGLNHYRDLARQLNRLPSQEEFLENDQSQIGDDQTEPEDYAIDFDKEWQDARDEAELVPERFSDYARCELLVWAVNSAQSELKDGVNLDAEIREFGLSEPTYGVDIALKTDSQEIYECRRLVLCNAANRNQRLAVQVKEALADADGVTLAVARERGFPKGARSQPASALQAVRASGGWVFDWPDEQWRLLKAAREFEQAMAQEIGFNCWRRERHWLLQLSEELCQLVSPPKGMIELPADAGSDSDQPPAGRIEESSISAQNRGEGAIYIGESQAGEDVYWDHARQAEPRVANFGFLVTGDAGQGKTQTIRILIDEVVTAGKPALIFDFKNDYAPEDFAGALGLEVYDIRYNGLPFNPLRPAPERDELVQPISHAHEITGALKRAFNLGAQQEAMLRAAIIDEYKEREIAPRQWIDPEATTWPCFNAVVERLLNDSKTAALVNRVSPLFDLNLFPVEDTSALHFDALMTKPAVLDLHALPTDPLKSALAEMTIMQLHNHALRGEQPRRLTRLVILDEAHRAATSPGLMRLAREGRAFGVGLVIGTQYPGDMPQDLTGSLATRLFLFNSEATHRRSTVQTLLGTTSSTEARQLADTLSKLAPFEGTFSNQHYQPYRMVKVKPHYSR